MFRMESIKSVHMLPNLAIKNVLDMSGFTTESKGNINDSLTVDAVGVTDTANFVLRQAGTRIGLAYGSLVSSLRHLVRVVIGSVAKEEMRRVTAWRVVALMEYPQAIGNRAMCNLPRKPMGTYGSTFRPEKPMSKRLGGTLPFPTVLRVATINLLPESFGFGDGSPVSKVITSIARTLPGAIAGSALLHFGQNRFKGGSAPFTDTRNTSVIDGTLGRHVSGPITDVSRLGMSNHRRGFSCPNYTRKPHGFGVLAGLSS